MGFPSGSELWIVLAVVLLIFGASRLPLMGRNLGQGIKEFKKGIKEGGKDDREVGRDAPAQAEGGATKPIADRRD